MIQFILNKKIIKSEAKPGMTLLDFIRYTENLHGTKIGCREGDCGACTVLIGSLENGKMTYKSVTSCITPLGNAAGKHVVTVEGINPEDENKLTPVQERMKEHGATQCGFCTPGFVVALTGHSLSDKVGEFKYAKDAVAGNICRCTGYKSIERAISDISQILKDRPESDSVNWLIDNNFLPDYFKDIPERLKQLKSEINENNAQVIIGGGTDIYVQKADETVDKTIRFFADMPEFKGISIKDDTITLGASTTVNEIMKSDIFKTHFPSLQEDLLLISSEQIRNTATIAGNFVNASPIGDMSIIFTALNANLTISDSKNERKIKLKDFFKGYKEIDLKEGEYIKSVDFKLLKGNPKFSFEKVSKRKHLDIASVNTAIYYAEQNNEIAEVHISGGGLAAIPTYFAKTRDFLTNKKINTDNINAAAEILESEVSPISDVRGSAEYKKLLLKQLFKAHFEKENV